MKRGRKTGRSSPRQGRTAEFGGDVLFADLDWGQYDVRSTNGFLRRLPDDSFKGGQDGRLARRRIRITTGRHMRDRVGLFTLEVVERIVTLETCMLAVRVGSFLPVDNRADEPLLRRRVRSRRFRHPRMRTGSLFVLHYPQEYLVERSPFSLRKLGAIQAGRFLHYTIGFLGKLLQLCRRKAEVLGKSKDVLAQAED